MVVIYFVFVIYWYSLSNMMESLKEMTELGQALGYEGDELKAFVRGQQEQEREERKSRREADKLKVENEREKREHERELKRLSDIQEERKREHEKHLAELEHDETLKKLELEKDKEKRAREINATVDRKSVV